jgi:hypothetical protein
MCLRLEALEDRSVPSTVMNLFDSGAGSLRDAIASTPASGTVNFQAGLSGTITLTTGELLINKDLTIVGPGVNVITVSGNLASRVFDIAATFTVATSGLTLADGTVSGINVTGGGIFNAGTLTLTDCVLSGNRASGPGTAGGGISNTGTLTVTNSTLSGNSAFGALGGSSGGGISNTGTLTVTNSTLSGNFAFAFRPGGGAGGGIYNGGTLTVTNSTLSGNSVSGASGRGGGIYNGGSLTVANSTLSGNSGSATFSFGGGIYNGGSLTFTNSTLSGNSAIGVGGGGPAGGGIYNTGTLTVTSATLSGNAARGLVPGAGGGIANAGTLTIRNTLVAGNTAAGSPDVSGALNSPGHNLIGDGTGGSGFAASDLVGTSSNPIDPKLGPLQDNGGPTQTMALLPDSPAIDAGDNAFAPGPYDQRGPGFPRIVNSIIDIGAFEAQAVALTVRCSVTTPVLWPPNDQLVNVGLRVQVSDPSATISVQVFANDDALASDAADLAPGTLRLRGDRQGGGDGRVYLVVVTATDAAGDVAVGVCTVVVPHDQSAGALAAVEQQAAEAEAYFRAFRTAPPGYRPLG